MSTAVYPRRPTNNNLLAFLGKFLLLGLGLDLHRRLKCGNGESFGLLERIRIVLGFALVAESTFQTVLRVARAEFECNGGMVRSELHVTVSGDECVAWVRHCCCCVIVDC